MREGCPLRLIADAAHGARQRQQMKGTTAMATQGTAEAGAAPTAKVETIRERLVREEREAQDKRTAELRAEREARERAAMEEEEKRRRAEEEEKRRRAEEEKRRAEQAAADAAARKERNAVLRAKEIEKLERAYVVFERAVAMLDELDKAEREGLNLGVTYSDETGKLRRAVTYSRDEAKRALLNPAARFKLLHIDD